MDKDNLTSIESIKDYVNNMYGTMGVPKNRMGGKIQDILHVDYSSMFNAEMCTMYQDILTQRKLYKAMKRKLNALESTSNKLLLLC